VVRERERVMGGGFPSGEHIEEQARQKPVVDGVVRWGVTGLPADAVWDCKGCASYSGGAGGAATGFPGGRFPNEHASRA